LSFFVLIIVLSVLLLATGWCFFSGTPVSSTNKTDRHDITEILLKDNVNNYKPNQSIDLRVLITPLVSSNSSSSNTNPMVILYIYKYHMINYTVQWIVCKWTIDWLLIKDK
jgi:hypothetical protein